MKKILFILLGVLCLAGCSKGTSLKNISYDDLNEKMKNNETFVLYIGSATCSHCEEFKPTLDDVIKKHKLEVYYIDMSKVSDEEYDSVKSKTNLQGTPTILLVDKGKSKYTKRLIGVNTEDATVEFFKEIGIIK